jgi:plastocyanin
MVKVGDAVIYVDDKGVQHNALVTAVWGNEYEGSGKPGLNLVFVSGDEKKDDSYGIQIERQTSVCHKVVQPAHGNYWVEK